LSVFLACAATNAHHQRGAQSGKRSVTRNVSALEYRDFVASPRLCDVNL
jgi:hypothetical protein